jgi:hypothetical protein
VERRALHCTDDMSKVHHRCWWELVLVLELAVVLGAEALAMVGW